MKFTLEIELGNEAMQRYREILAAINDALISRPGARSSRPSEDDSGPNPRHQRKHSRQMGDFSMKTPLDSIQVTMPAPEVLYRLASDRLKRRKALDEGLIPDCTSGSAAEHLNHIAVQLLIANGGR